MNLAIAFVIVHHCVSDSVPQALEDYGANFNTAIVSLIQAFPLQHLAIAFDNHTDSYLLQQLAHNIFVTGIAATLFDITSESQQKQYFEYLEKKYAKYEDLTTLFLSNHKFYEHVLVEVSENNYIRQNLFYMFYWGKGNVGHFFVKSMLEAMKIVVITNPRNDTYRILYNQAFPDKKHHLALVNWWNLGGLFRHPTLPSAFDTYKNMQGKIFSVPVIHKPPWYFVHYDNYSFYVEGGRDHKLLGLLAKKLNFRYEYFDPPERTQGVSFGTNGNFYGVLGLVWRREADLFLGDVALTTERLNVVEFSFITLADSAAFVTHAPGKLNESLALVRPFDWKVWPLIFLTLALSGPILYCLVILPNIWQPKFLVGSYGKLFCDCCWYTASLFLKQTVKLPFDSNKIRFFAIMLSISATYIIADMYSANLTSLLAKPGRERSVNDLYELEEAMSKRCYRLYVERDSSSYNLLENGTGIYTRLWKLMNQQHSFLIDTLEEGVINVRDSSKVAVLGGRETLFFDIQRFGAKNFHLSKKLNTVYSAIALQIGCPYLENINSVLMSVFEAGILTKMTENEYVKLGKKQSEVNSGTPGAVVPSGKKETRKVVKATRDNEKLQPISLKMLQGAFYLLFVGNALSGLTLLLELTICHMRFRFKRRKIRNKCKCLRRVGNVIRSKIRDTANYIRQRYRNFINEAIIETFEFTE